MATIIVDIPYIVDYVAINDGVRARGGLGFPGILILLLDAVRIYKNYLAHQGISIFSIYNIRRSQYLRDT